jgi:hypothetical protein
MIFLRGRIMAVLGLSLGGVVFAASGSQLAVRSPFTSAAPSPRPAQGEAAALRLTGIMRTPDGVYFCIFDTSKKKTLGWFALNETGNAFVIRGYDSVRDAVTVDLGGVALQLSLRKSNVQAMAPNSGPAPSESLEVQTPTGATPVVQAVSAEEQRERIRKIREANQAAARVHAATERAAVLSVPPSS